MWLRAEGDGVNGTGSQHRRTDFGEVREGLPGSTLERGMHAEKRQELGRPCGFPSGDAIRNDGAQGIRLVSPHRGKPGPR